MQLSAPRAGIWLALWALAAFAPGVVATAAAQGVTDEPCPLGAIAVAPGASIQAAVDRAGEGAVFCLQAGIHRMQVIRPKRGQSFHGERHTILNGSRLLTTFSHEGRFWVASGQDQLGRRNGNCANENPACNLPESFFIDDKPLGHVLSKESVEAGLFYLDYASGRLYFVDDPTERKVEATVAAFAFEGTASDVLIRNITVEKYSSVAGKGAIQGKGGPGWIVENCEVRLNSGAGIVIGTGGRVRGCDVHHNGQIGIAGQGKDILIENNRIWENNTHGFDFEWEAGGVKVVASDGVVFRRNHVHDNIGPGLWCDIECRDVVYEGNLVERNHDAGIFHEISYQAIIRDNVLRYNGFGHRKWFWGPEILVAASQDVEVYGNTLTVAVGGCGIVLVDQGRAMKTGGRHKTRDNKIYDNVTTFEGEARAGAASDVGAGDENASIIEDGNNLFDRNIYRVPRGNAQLWFAWGHAVFGWEELRRAGLEQNGSLIIY
jgi:hypothetical protein